MFELSILPASIKLQQASMQEEKISDHSGKVWNGDHLEPFWNEEIILGTSSGCRPLDELYH